MRRNRLRELFEQEQLAIGGWLSINSSYSAELIGHAGYDAVVVDLQHAPIFLDTAIPMLQAISSTPAMPMARCSTNELSQINKLLDGGAWGIICPLVNTAEDAMQFVSACRYPPQGLRSFGPTRGLLYGGSDYFQQANSTIVTYAMVETKEALDNLEEICAVTGLDGVMIGPSDLGISLGVGPTPDWTLEPVASALKRIVRTVREANKMSSIVCMKTSFAQSMKEHGFDFIIAGTDSSILRDAATHFVAGLRKD